MPSYFLESYNASFVWSWLWWQERGCTWCLSIWSPSYHQYQLGLLKYILYCHLCSTIALSHVIFWSGWTSRAHLIYPLLSCYQVVSPDHDHLPMNMIALMVGILRVEERGNESTSQATDIDSRSRLQMFLDWLKTHPSARDHKTASWGVFYRVSFEKEACIMNGFLEH